MAAKRGNPAAAKEDRENARIGEKAAQDYVADKGYSESSMEAARRAAKANKRRPPRIRVGGYGAEV